MPTTVARVALDVLPDLSNFGKELANGVSKAAPQANAAAEREGREAGKRYGSGASQGAKQESEQGFAAAGRKAGERFSESAKESTHNLAKSVFAGIGLVGVGELGEHALEAADQLEAANIKIEGSFGESSKSVRSWAQTMAGSYGVSATEAEQAAGTFGQMLHSMGVGQEEAATMSEKMSELAQNVAKFNNADPASVQAAFVAAMRGRGKALAQLGINMDTTVIAAEAMRHHLVSMHVDQAKVTTAQLAYNKAVANQEKIDKDTKATSTQRKVALQEVALAHTKLKDAMGGSLPTLTASQKGEAAYYAILDGTKNQQDAVAKSSETLAQRKRILTAEVTNLEAKLGNVLMPVFAKLFGYLIRDVIPAIQSTAHWIKQNKDWLVPLVEVLGGAFLAYKLVSGVMDTAQKVMKFFGLATAEATTATEGETVAQEGLNTAMEANPIGLVVAAITALVAGLMLAWQHSKTFRDIVTGAFNAVKSAVLAVVNWFRTDFLHFFTQTIPHAWHSLISGIENVWHDVWGFLKKWGPVALAVLAPFIGIPLLIWQHFDKIKGWIEGVFSSVVGTVKHWINEAVTFISGLPGRLGNLAGDMLKAGGHLMSQFLQGLASAAGEVGDVAKNIVNAVIGFINNHVIDPIKNFTFTIGAFGVHHTFQPFGSLPDIPTLARGGMTTGLTAAIIGDNPSGHEAVLPLDSPRTIAALSQAMHAAGRAGGGSSGPSRIHGELTIGPDSQGRLRAWVRGVVLDEQDHAATVSRMRVGA